MSPLTLAGADVPTMFSILHQNINDIYVENEFVTGIDIALNDYKTVFVSTRQARGALPAEWI